MGNYLGIKCPVCWARFAAADDVVVCPICGAPHHRHCYAERGECMFTADHISGKEWRPPADESTNGFGNGAEDQEGIKVCVRCKSDNPPVTLFCQVCGQPMTAVNYSARPEQERQQGDWGRVLHDYTAQFREAEDAYYDSIAADKEPISGLPAKDVAMYIGPNCSYFLPRFYQIEEQRKGAQINLPACFFNFFYYFYRKMYRVGAVMLALFLLCLIPLFLFYWEMLPVLLHQSGLTGPPTVPIDMQRAELYAAVFWGIFLVNFILSFILSFFTNRMYHKQVVTHIQTLMQGNQGVGYRAALYESGGVDRMKTMLVGVSLFVGINFINAIMVYVSNLL